ncbi:hypothetical protein AB2M62_08675 [Sphingomonas sp. MMS12-HWE2-04]|uniref:hypothetical protein n=1 Tax=Sphingomonas sp. MMS12-HWE2-04 TaxID=3234199 RepID=UPI00384B4B6D
MSARSGISVLTLSRVEHDPLTLTYDKLLQLSQRLNIRMSKLSPRMTRLPNRRRSNGAASAVYVHTANCNHYYLCTNCTGSERSR